MAKQYGVMAITDVIKGGKACYIAANEQTADFIKDKQIVRFEMLNETRSSKQNALWSAWYSEIAKCLGWTVLQARCYCKLYCGVPILRHYKPNFRRVYDAYIKPMDIKDKLDLMTEWPVTRDLNVKQGVEYQEAIQKLVRNEFNILLHVS